MHFVSPKAPNDFRQRDQLLMESLRPDPLPFAIHEEYPIVLDPLHGEFSHVITEEDIVVAHANLWPRMIRDCAQKISIPIGLIGNVATSAQKRSQGYMTKLMDHLKTQSRQMGLNALILWSDLLPFYQNLGFTSLGREYRFFFNQRSLSNISYEPSGLIEMNPGGLSKKDLQSLLRIRYPAPYTLDRSLDEFKRLLHIPALRMFVGKATRRQRYFIMGKGYDMVGVIHEWGAESPAALAGGVLEIMTLTGVENLIVLAPGSMASRWVEELSQYAVKCETHPMALCYQNKEGSQLDIILREFFVWGLDSI